ncbi:zinc-ribbon domain-containing protein [Croceivirga thetidis]|nr:zinc-ribbon domain-containing protein [Croceivirga thetidis]
MEQRKLVGATCSYCKQTNTLNLIEQANFFHLFWIKLFKIHTNRFAECSHCKKAYLEKELPSEIIRT